MFGALHMCGKVSYQTHNTQITMFVVLHVADCDDSKFQVRMRA
jgi:hypothetical protein